MSSIVFGLVRDEHDHDDESTQSPVCRGESKTENRNEII